MERAGKDRIGTLVLAVVLAGAGAAAGAQAPMSPAERTNASAIPAKSRGSGGSIAGTLTDLGSRPLAGATIVARNETTGAEARTTTAKNGRYRLTGLEAGQYTLEAESAQVGRGRLQGIYVAGGGYEARVQAAMAFERAPASSPGKAEAVKRMPATPPGSTETPQQQRDTLAAVATDLPAEPARELELTPRSLSPQVPVMTARLPPESLGSIALVPLLRMVPADRAETGEPTSRAAAVLPSPWPAPRAEQALRWVAASAATAAINSVEGPSPKSQSESMQIEPLSPLSETKISGADLQSLPAAGRRWQDFLPDTAPGSAEARSNDALRGAGQGAPETSIEGTGTRLAFGGSGGAGPDGSGSGSNGQDEAAQSSGTARAWADSRGSPVAEAAIRAVETAAANAETEASRAAGGQMNVETARGATGLHGQGFLFDRQNTWGAQNPFTQWVKQTVPATETTTPTFSPSSYTPPDHETVWGVGVGSQIKRDKLFWFGALDSYNRNDPGLATVKHPAEFFAQPANDQMQVLAARLGLSSVNPVAEGLGVYSGMLATLDGLLGPAARTAAQWVGFGRLDWDATERHRFTLQGTGAHWDSPGGGLTRVSETYGTNSFGSSQASEFLLLGRWEAFVTPNLLAVTQGSAGRNLQSAHPDTPSTYEQSFLSADPWGQLPQIGVDSRYGFTIGNPSRFGMGSYPDEHALQAQETVSWVRGNLLLKGGFDLSHNADATSFLRNETGTYNYASAENFASDALVFAAYGLAGESNPDDQHNCDQTGRVWRDTTGTLHGLGYLPCYSYFSQTLGPTDWNLSTNDWAGFTTVQWQARKLLVVSGGLRWEREQLPPTIAALNNPDLPQTEKLAGLGSDWGPRFSLALGSKESRWPVLRLGYGLYFGRTENATLETALTQTGSLKGDLSFFMRPADNCQFCGGGAPAFPFVPTGPPGSVIKPGAFEFASGFRNPEVHQALAAVEQELPGHVQVTAAALVSLGRRLPVRVDANLDLPTPLQTITYNVCDQTPTGADNGQCGNLGLGPIKAAQITVPYYASWPASTATCPFYQPTGLAAAGWLCPGYQEIDQFTSKANSIYEAATIKVARYGRRGLNLRGHYTYSHAMDWNPDESPMSPDVLSQASSFKQEYGTSNFDMRHSAAATVIYEAPWKLSNLAGKLANGWMLSGIAQFRSGMPYTMRTSGSLAEEFTSGGAAIVALGPGMNGSGGDNRVYGVGSDNRIYNIGRNTYRYPAAWKADMRVGKKIGLGQMRQLELLVESFNLFNHQNVTELETTGYYIESGSPPSAPGSAGTPPTLNFLTGLKINPTTGLATTGFGQPLNVNATNFYRERQIQVGVRARF